VNIHLSLSEVTFPGLIHRAQMKGPSMNLFRTRKKFQVSERDPTYKVRYLGNLQTSLMRGDGCTDKAAGILWSNFQKNIGAGLEMKLTICATGLKALTKEQGVTEYRAHRISYCIAHPDYPRVFLWVYRHEGKKMKVELRCHAVLCQKAEKARAIAVQLHDKLTCAFSEFVREKTRRQNARLALQRTNSLPACTNRESIGTPLRRRFLSTAQNFKPSIESAGNAPKLGSIIEDCEQGQDVLEEDEEESEDEDDELAGGLSARELTLRKMSRDEMLLRGIRQHSDGDLNLRLNNANLPSLEAEEDTYLNSMLDIEVGNDVDALKADQKVQYEMRGFEDDEDDDSSESGFGERLSLKRSTGSTGSSSSTGSCESVVGPGLEGLEDPHLQQHLDDDIIDGMTSLCYLPLPPEELLVADVSIMGRAIDVL